MPPSIRRKLINVCPLYLSLAVTWAHVLLSPYTKVEESFTLHAVHDVLAYGHQPGELSKVSVLHAKRLNADSLVGPYNVSWSCSEVLCPSYTARSAHIPLFGAFDIYGLDQNQAGRTDPRQVCSMSVCIS
jgi:hypothetical protein